MPQVFMRRGVLFIDSDLEMLAACTTATRNQNYNVDTSAPADALDHMARGSYGVVALDFDLPGPASRSLMEHLCAQHPATTFVAITRHAANVATRSGRLDTAISSVVLWPFDPADLLTALDGAFELHDRRIRNRVAAFDRAAVLLVEDHAGDAELIIEHLSEVCGAVVTHCRRLEDGVRHLHEHTYDFVISDLTLPDARGLDAVRRLQPLAPDTPLVVLSGIDDEELALQAVQAGAQDYLVKGQLDAPSLRRTLRHARERKQTASRLIYLTRHDPLTGVANRAALRERIETTLARGQRHELAFAVMFIDLDRFKAINDTCGHDVGDAVLRVTSDRLREAVRTSDVVARLGGDEFAVFLDDVGSGSRPVEIAERVLTSLERPIVVDGNALVVTASIGVARYPEVTGTVDDILKAADSAMYLAKGRGRNNVQVYGAVPDEQRARQALAADLQHALERGELALHFQPQYTVNCQRIVAFEALLRWNRHGTTPVSPAEFIPLLEENGRIIAVGEWVLERACEQLAGWRAAGWTELRMAVNLSARQIAFPGLVACVRRCLRRYDVPAGCIELEITESMLMGDTTQSAAILAELRALGVRLAIDDFGTGYSSLAYLSRFAVDCLKIDRSFIHEVHCDRERALITSTIVTLGHHLGLEVVAEGVETAEQLAFLSATKCDLVQGYLLGRPAAASTFTQAGRSRFLLTDAALAC
jgi:diguanylate cyclase (GGDEF)-like protein